MRHQQRIPKKKLTEKKESSERINKMRVLRRRRGKMGADKEPHVPVILVDEKNEKDFQSTKIKDTGNLNIILWYCSWSKIQVLIGLVVNRCWEKVQKMCIHVSEGLLPNYRIKKIVAWKGSGLKGKGLS